VIEMLLDLLFFIRGGGGCNCDKHDPYGGLNSLRAEPN